MVEFVKSTQGATSARPPRPVPYSSTGDSGAHFDSLAMLLVETAAGHEKAFARLYGLTGGRLLAVARRVVRHTDLAEDVLQDSFLRIWRCAHQYSPGKGSAYAWLATVVRRRALSARVRLSMYDRGRDEFDSEELAFDGPDPADQAVRNEEARRVRACLDNLPVSHRQSVALVYFEGLTHKELAQRLDVQLGTAKSWVRRGLLQMGQCLASSADIDLRDLVATEHAVDGCQDTAQRRAARYCRATDRRIGKLASLTELFPDGKPAEARSGVGSNGASGKVVSPAVRYSGGLQPASRSSVWH